MEDIRRQSVPVLKAGCQNQSGVLHFWSDIHPSGLKGFILSRVSKICAISATYAPVCLNKRRPHLAQRLELDLSFPGCPLF